MAKLIKKSVISMTKIGKIYSQHVITNRKRKKPDTKV